MRNYYVVIGTLKRVNFEEATAAAAEGAEVVCRTRLGVVGSPKKGVDAFLVFEAYTRLESAFEAAKELNLSVSKVYRTLDDEDRHGNIPAEMLDKARSMRRSMRRSTRRAR